MYHALPNDLVQSVSSHTPESQQKDQSLQFHIYRAIMNLYRFQLEIQDLFLYADVNHSINLH
ncbi:hypothetical protein D3C84_1221040 [compost metagenome]